MKKMEIRIRGEFKEIHAIHLTAEKHKMEVSKIIADTDYGEYTGKFVLHLHAVCADGIIEAIENQGIPF